MSFVAFVGGKGGATVTTTAIATAVGWPREVLLVDADPSGGDVVPGFLPGRVSADQGLLTWLASTRRESATDAAMLLGAHCVSVPEAPSVWLLPGLQHAGQAPTLAVGGWDRLAMSLERVGSATGRDVVVDLGRVSETTGWPLLRSADLVVLCVRPTARSIQGAKIAAEVLVERLGDLDQVRLVVSCAGRGPYGASDISGQLQVQLLGEVPFDERTATVLTEGGATPSSLARSRLVRAGEGIAQAAQRFVASHRIRPMVEG